METSEIVELIGRLGFDHVEDGNYGKTVGETLLVVEMKKASLVVIEHEPSLGLPKTVSRLYKHTCPKWIEAVLGPAH